MAIIAPSLLASDFANLQKEIEMVNNSQADWLHLDVMDGVFVPNISFGTPIIQAVEKHCKKLLDVHLMIVEPEKYIDLFHSLGAQVLSVHLEATNHLHRTLSEIKKKGMQAGVAINPHTPVYLLKDVIELVDVLVIMSVNPGFGGQKFIEKTYDKITEAKELINRVGANTKIEIDGGVGIQNAKKLVDCGADILVAGSSVFKAENPMEAIVALNKH